MTHSGSIIAGSNPFWAFSQTKYKVRFLIS
jgi:hypothetical protein